MVHVASIIENKIESLLFLDVVERVLIEETKNWHDARTHCQSLNGQLMEARTQEEYELAQELVREVNAWLWFGGSDHGEEGTWVWASDGQRIEESDYVDFWGVDQPNFVTNDDDFLCLNPNPTLQKFYDCPASRKKFFCTFP